jgi:carboxypeptidase Taq
MQESINFIYKEQKELSTLGGVSALLGWDQMTYMPVMGAQERSEQIAIISRLVHERIISDEFWNHIENLSKPINFDKISNKDKIVVTRLKKDVEKARKIPPDFVEKAAKITTLSYPAWQKAREKSNYSIFSPHLKKIIDLEKEYCNYINLPGPK